MTLTSADCTSRGYLGFTLGAPRTDLRRRTFFGGDDSSWATPQTVHTYFRNIQLWGSSSPSNLTGTVVSAAAPSSLGEARWLVVLLSGAGAVLLSGLV